MNRVLETVSWLAASTGVALLAASVFLVPHSRALGQGGVPLAPTVCTGTTDCLNSSKCQAPDCVDQGDGCKQQSNPEQCKDCECKPNDMLLCDCKKPGQ